MVCCCRGIYDDVSITDAPWNRTSRTGICTISRPPRHFLRSWYQICLEVVTPGTIGLWCRKISIKVEIRESFSHGNVFSVDEDMEKLHAYRLMLVVKIMVILP